MEDAKRTVGEKARSFLGRIWNYIKRHKKPFIILAVLAVIAGIILYMFSGVLGAGPNAVLAPQTLTLERMDLQQIVSGTGTLQASAPREVTSGLSYEILEIYVEEGDYVRAGQLLAQLDTTDIDKDIKDARTSIAEAEEKDALSLAQAERRLQDAINTRAINWEKNEKNVQNALDAIEAARTAAGTAARESAATAAAQNATAALASDLSAAQAALSAAQAAHNAANVTFQTTLGHLAQCDAAADKDAAAIALGYSGYLDLTAQHGAAQAALAGEEAKVAAAQAAAAAAQSAYSNAYQSAYENAWNAAQSVYDSAYGSANVSSQTAAYNTAVETRDSAYRSDSISIENARDTVNTQKLQDSAASYRTQLAGYLETKEDCSLKAPVAGTITAMAAEVGKSASGSAMGGGTGTTAATASSALFTIENVASLEITASIPEYDAVIVKTGMQVSITSDALTGQAWSGTVASLSAKAADDNGNFTVTISVTSPVGQLAIGMSAKINIITNSKNGVFAVPYDAVTTNAAGESVVYVYAESMLAQAQNNPPQPGSAGEEEAAATPAAMGTPLVVQTGMETDYYIEISASGLEEGMVLLADPEGKNVSTGATGMMFPQGGGF